MAHLEITCLDEQAIDQALDDNKNTYLLVDTLAIERWAYVPLSPDSLEIPEVKELADILKEHDRYIKLQWLWEDTEWQKHYRQGPCLVQLETSSPLLNFFTETLAALNFGIVLQTSQSETALIKHLQSLLRVTIEDKGLTYFTFHSPNAIASYFDALSSHKMLQLLGPIEHIIWRQNTGKAYQWFSYFSDDVNNAQMFESNSSNELGWFHFSQDEMRSINQDSLLHFRKSLINDALYYREQGYFERQPTMALQKLSEADIQERIYQLLSDADRYNIVDKNLKQRWVELNLYYQNFVKSPDIEKLLKDTEQHPNKRIKQVNYLINERLEKDTAGEAS